MHIIASVTTPDETLDSLRYEINSIEFNQEEAVNNVMAFHNYYGQKTNILLPQHIIQLREIISNSSINMLRERNLMKNHAPNFPMLFIHSRQITFSLYRILPRNHITLIHTKPKV